MNWVYVERHIQMFVTEVVLIKDTQWLSPETESQMRSAIASPGCFPISPPSMTGEYIFSKLHQQNHITSSVILWLLLFCSPNLGHALPTACTFSERELTSNVSRWALAFSFQSLAAKGRYGFLSTRWTACFYCLVSCLPDFGLPQSRDMWQAPSLTKTQRI